MVRLQPQGPALIARLLTLLLLALVPVARAQVDLLAPGADEQGVRLAARFGFDDSMAAERWNPVSVTIESDRTFSGVLLIEYDQDATQTARLALPVSPVAGVPVTAQALVCPPVILMRIRITLYDDRGRIAAEAVWGDDPLGAPMPAIRRENDRRLLAIGAAGPEKALNLLETPYPDPADTRGGRVYVMRDSEPDLLRAVGASTLAPLPIEWAGYDGLESVVANASSISRLDPRAAAALARWVRGGGRLVLLAHQPGSEAAAWLALLGEAEPPFTLGEIERTDPRDAEPLAAQTDAQTDAKNDASGPTQAEPTWRSSVQRRAIGITPSGERNGWRFALGDLVARGPVGFGEVLVCGVDPSELPDAGPAEAGKIWTHLSAGAVERVEPDDDNDRRAWWFGTASGADAQERGAIESAANQTVTQPRLSHALFAVLAVATGLLALLVGPVDFLALKRLRARQRSWLTATGWIALAGAAGVIGPMLVRTAPTSVGRVGVVDVLCAPAGENTYASAESWRSVVTGVFTGKTGSVRLAGLEPTTGSTGPVVVRGVSPARVYGFNAGRLLKLPLAQSRGAVYPGPIPAQTWMLRFLFEQGPSDSRLLVAAPAPGEYTVRGLPDGAIGRVVLHGPSERPEYLGLYREPDGALRLTRSGRFADAGDALELPGVARRGLASKSRLAAGWSQIEIQLLAPQPSVTVDPDSTVGADTKPGGMTVYRVLIPHAPEPSDD